MNVIWIIEDNPAFRASTTRGLEAAELQCEAIAFCCCEDAIVHLDEGKLPDVVLMDIGLPGMDGIDGIGEIKQRHPECSILILTVFEDDDKIFRALKAGASGYLLKSESISKVSEAIELVLQGAAPINPRVASRVLAMFTETRPSTEDYGLTDRELAVLDCMTRGLVRKQTALKLGLNIHTVDYVMRRIYKKLHVNGATEAVALAVRDRLL
ncbi:MAG: response regulator transcription factor [Planctomycetota bacterium]